MLEKSLLLNKKSLIPRGVGVYIFLNKKKEFLYIGKSNNVRSRVFSYFKKPSIKQKKIIDSFFYIDYVLVDSEKDALFLENSFIKKHQPKYNILLKDDKNYPWLCLTKERFPRFFITRKRNFSSCFYYGPYVSKKRLNFLYDLIIKNYPIRSCKYNLSKKNVSIKKYNVCLDYHLKKCLGPCEGFQSEEDYNKNIDSIKKILSGKYSFILSSLEKKLKIYSSSLLFEKANIIKNQILAIKNLKQKSVVVSNKNINTDCFYLIRFNKYIYINFVRVVEGSVVYLKNNKIKNHLLFKNDFILKNYIKTIYFDYGFFSESVVSNINIGCFLNKKITIPKSGFKKNILDFSYNSLFDFININSVDNVGVLKGLKKIFFLKKTPFHIECFDVSTLKGKNTVSSCVVFKNGKPSKEDYTYYDLGYINNNDDYLSISESLKKRYTDCVVYPDLIVIDGGKGHLNTAIKMLKFLKLDFLNIISIAKKNEIIYLKNLKEIILNKKSSSLKLIQFIRNEAHRFCLKHHRIRRKLNFINSELNNISGVGNKTVFKLLNKFKTLNKIKDLSKNELVSFLGLKKGIIIYEHFKK